MNMNISILIIGYGIVGHNLANELAVLHPDIYDKYKVECNTKQNIEYDIAFICVDTPKTENSICDITEVIKAIEENAAKLYVIKSTVLPCTTDKLVKSLNKKIIFSPEYYGSTQHCNNFEFDYTILGGNKQDCIYVQQILQHCYDARHRFHIVDAKTAELAKYMENAWLATKVSFCVQFAQLAEKANIDYEILRELFILDPRVNPSHTFVYKDHSYWDSHCLNKDVPAIAKWGNAELLNAIIAFNEKCKK